MAGRRRARSITPTLLEKDVVLALGSASADANSQSRGIAAGLLRNSDVAIGLDQRATATNAARAALYITLHAANTGRGVHVFTSLLPATNVAAHGFLPWDTAQASFLDLSGTVAGSVAAELEIAQAAEHHAGRAVAADEQRRRTGDCGRDRSPGR